MKILKNLALVTGLLALTGVAQAQFSSTWTAVSDYDFRGASQSAKNPALQGSADYAFSNGIAIGAWASNVDFDTDEDLEVDLYLNYTGKINDTFAFTAGGTWYEYPTGDASDGYAEVYAGFNAGNFSAKQWFANDFYALEESKTALYTELNYTQPAGPVSLAFHAGYSWGEFWEDGVGEVFDYAVGVNYTYSHINFGAKFTGTDASGPAKVTIDAGNNEPRFLVSVSTTFPWGD